MGAESRITLFVHKVAFMTFLTFIWLIYEVTSAIYNNLIASNQIGFALYLFESSIFENDKNACLNFSKNVLYITVKV